jgi:hypothetical protein
MQLHVPVFLPHPLLSPAPGESGGGLITVRLFLKPLPHRGRGWGEVELKLRKQCVFLIKPIAIKIIFANII